MCFIIKHRRWSDALVLFVGIDLWKLKFQIWPGLTFSLHGVCPLYTPLTCCLFLSPFLLSFFPAPPSLFVSSMNSHKISLNYFRSFHFKSKLKLFFMWLYIVQRTTGGKKNPKYNVIFYRKKQKIEFLGHHRSRYTSQSNNLRYFMRFFLSLKQEILKSIRIHALYLDSLFNPQVKPRQ